MMSYGGIFVFSCTCTAVEYCNIFEVCSPCIEAELVLNSSFTESSVPILG